MRDFVLLSRLYPTRSPYDPGRTKDGLTSDSGTNSSSTLVLKWEESAARLLSCWAPYTFAWLEGFLVLCRQDPPRHPSAIHCSTWLIRSMPLKSWGNEDFLWKGHHWIWKPLSVLPFKLQVGQRIIAMWVAVMDKGMGIAIPFRELTSISRKC